MINKGHDLSGSAQIIKKCLEDIPELVHCWRFLAGVVFALRQYTEISCNSSATISDENIYINETEDILTFILNNETPKENWQKGFYYNAALMRLDAAYERFFKAYLEGKYGENNKCSKCGRNKIDGRYLYGEIRKRFSTLFTEKYETSNFNKVRRAVNSLKHYVGGADVVEREQPHVLYRALAELVDFLRDPTAIKELKKFSGKGIIAGRKYKSQQVTHTDPE